MKILKARVNWMDGWANDPELQLLVDRIPNMNEMRFEHRGTLYVAEKEGYVVFYHYTKPGSGFGGASFDITMQDGSKQSLKGPWSSRAACVNAYWPERPVFDCCLTDNAKDFDRGYTFYAGHVTLEIAQRAVKSLSLQLQKKEGDDLGPHWIVGGKEKRKNAKNWPPKKSYSRVAEVK